MVVVLSSQGELACTGCLTKAEDGAAVRGAPPSNGEDELRVLPLEVRAVRVQAPSSNQRLKPGPSWSGFDR